MSKDTRERLAEPFLVVCAQKMWLCSPEGEGQVGKIKDHRVFAHYFISQSVHS